MKPRQAKRTPSPPCFDLSKALAEIIANPLSIAPLTAILTADSDTIPFTPFPAQRRILQEVQEHRWVIILKARQIGSTTALLFHFVVQAMLRPGYRVRVVAQDHEAAIKLSAIALRFVTNFPEALVPRYKSNLSTITFQHEGRVDFATARSANVRGSTYNAVLATEVAFWPDFQTTSKSLFQSLSGNDTTLVMESTPDGINEFHRLWSSSGYHKLFLGWFLDPRYVSDQTHTPPSQDLLDYQKIYALTDAQIRWAAQHLARKCAGSMATFRQEMAADPQTCFIRSGDAFFEPNQAWETAQFSPGLHTYEHPATREQARQRSYAKQTYVIGVDSASGSNSPDADYSAAVVLNVTKPNQATIAATLFAKESPQTWGYTIAQLGKRYLSGNANEVTLNIERTGGWGVPAIDAAIQAGLVLHRQRKPAAKGTAGYQPTQHGWDTNQESRNSLLTNLQYQVNANRVTLTCPNLQYQAARYVYIDGRPDHTPGEHDDGLFALALALVASPSHSYHTHTPTQLHYPTTATEMHQLQGRTGKTINQLTSEGAFDNHASYVDSTDDGYY